MLDFQYKHGDRPLKGYTIQRGAGRGGFGEVYYAVSDSGREVALKVVQAYEHIELRGITQCMNLKSPHLVSIFDVQYNDQGRPFIIMEYVSGPSLRELLDQSPSGLGEQKAAFFLREIAKGLSYLHDCGIVHRDLKPGNIFYENGYVKIGDYGLSKSISADHRSQQTVTVGTVHYMAPEIGAGRYDRGIDIYALGAMLFEMLTGQPPFFGSSAGEILIKHITAEPDVKGIGEPFATVIRKSMSKDPNQRYQTVQEMVEAVFGSEHIQRSVSVFSPLELTMVAGRAAAKVGAPAGVGAGVGAGSAAGEAGPAAATADGTFSPSSTPGTPPPGDVWGRLDNAADQVAHRLTEVGDRMAQMGLDLARRKKLINDPTPAQAADAGAQAPAPVLDPMPQPRRRLLALIAVAVISLASSGASGSPGAFLFVFLGICGIVLGSIYYHQRLSVRMRNESHKAQRVARAVAALVPMLALTLPVGAGFALSGGTWLAIAIPLLILETQRWVDPNRAQRVSFWDTALPAGLLGFVFSTIFKGDQGIPMAVLAGSALATQVLMPWTPRGMAAAAQAVAAARRAGAMPAFVPVPEPVRLVSPWVPMLWLLGTAAFLAAGLFMVIWGATSHDGNLVHQDPQFYAACIAMGVTWLLAAVVCFIQSFRRRFTGWWSYLVRPTLLVMSVQVVLACAMLLGVERLGDEDRAIALALLICFGVLLLVLPFIRMPRPAMRMQAMPMRGPTPGPKPAEAPAASAPDVGATAPSPVAPATLPPVADPMAAMASWVMAERRRPNPFLAAVAGLLGLVAFVLGVGLAIKFPQMVAAGFPDPSLARDTERLFGYAEWPGLVQRAGWLVLVFLLMLSGIVAMLARRPVGAMHMLRGLVAPLVLLGAFYMLHSSVPAPAWGAIVESGNAGKIGPAIEQFVQGADRMKLISAGIVFLISMVLSAWPAPRRDEAMALGSVPGSVPASAGEATGTATKGA